MPTNPKRNPIHAEADDGSPIVLMPLASSPAPAVLDAADWTELQEAGVTPHWCRNVGKGGFAYVRCQAGGSTQNVVTVARLILKARRGQIVKYRDGSPLNLRRSNLFTTSGRAHGREVVALAELSHAAFARGLAERVAAE